MSLSPARRILVVVVVLLLRSAPVRPVTPDPKLLRLVPRDTKILSGIKPAPPGNRHGRFVLITPKNAKDMQDFRGLSGSDATRQIYEVLFASKSGDPGEREEHSLLVSGHFDQARIYRSAIDGGGKSTDYRGFHVVAIKPFTRDQDGMDEVRWLAVLDSSVLVLGTVASVMKELDQRLIPAAPDPRLMQMLGALRRDDDAWSIVLGAKNGGIREALTALSPDLAKLADARVLRLGIRYAHSIEFEYAIDPSPASDEPVGSDSAESRENASTPGSFSLLPSLALDMGNNGSAHGVVKVPKDVYDRWLEEVSRRARERWGTSP